MLSFGEVGIQALATGYAESSLIDADGNAHRQIGRYLRVDGGEAAAADVWFATDPAYSIATGWAEVPDDIAALPDLAGSGTVRDLRQAMALDATGRLQTTVAAFAAEPDEGRRRALTREIVLLWAGVDGLDPASRGSYVDARELAAQERLTGQDFNQPGWGANPGSTAGRRLTEDFALLVDGIHAQLDAQVRYAELHGLAGLVWDAQTGAMRLDLTGVADALLAQYVRDPAAGLDLLDGFARNLAGLGYTEVAGWAELGGRLSGAIPQAADILRVARLPTLTGIHLADDLSGTSADERLLGFDGNDALDGKAGNDLVEGGAGDDALIGGAGDDTLLGGDGADQLNGGSGGDLYVFARGGGHDTIRQYDNGTDGEDVAHFPDRAAADVVAVVRAGDDLMLDLGGGDELTVSEYFDSAARRVDLFEFADGTAWDALAIKSRAVTEGTAAADTLYGYNGAGNRILGGAGDDRLHGGDAADSLAGEAGDDRLYGKSGADSLVGGAGDDVLQGGLDDDRLQGDVGDDTLDGGAGNDTLAGGGGSDSLLGGPGHDTYLVDGQGDVITERADEGTDTVQSSVSWTLGANLENLTLTGTAAIDGTGNGLSNVLIGNGATNALSGGAGNDTLLGGAGVDTFAGGGGNDTLIGDASGDSYLFSRGDGADTILDGDATPGNTDVLTLSGIDHDQLWFGKHGLDLEIRVIGTSDRVTVQFWGVGGGWHIERIEAGGRALLDSQVDALVQAMAAFAPPAAGESCLPDNYRQALEPVLAASWQ